MSAASEFVFGPAVRRAKPVLLGIAGPAGCGKTFSALRLATGLADGGKIGVVDTENYRAAQYADRFRFQHCPVEPDFTPERYRAAMQAGVAAGCAVVVVDSATHEWAGTGGILDIQEATFKRLGGRDAVKLLSWAEPKARHDAWIDYIERFPVHLVLCFRAKEKLKPIADDKGKMVPTNMGWTPITGDRLSFALDATLILAEGSKGRPDLDERSTKLDAEGFPFVRQAEQITEAMGEAFLEWSRGKSYTGPTALNDVPTDDKVLLGLRQLVARLEATTSIEAYDAVLRAPAAAAWLVKLREERPSAFHDVKRMVAACEARGGPLVPVKMIEHQGSPTDG